MKNEKVQNFEHIVFKDALIEYRGTVSINKKGASQEIIRINYILKNMDCSKTLIDVDKEMLVKWRVWRLETIKGATVRHEFLMLKGFFTWSIETKLWLGVVAHLRMCPYLKNQSIESVLLLKKK